jgi:predicted nuclease with TOPRIM domain
MAIAMADEPENLVLLQLQGLRCEMATLLEHRACARKLVLRIYNELMAFRSEVREEMHELKGDMISLENQMQNRHNEVLSVMRRLDALGAPPD